MCTNEEINSNLSLNDLHQYAWDYFQLHTRQRMSLVNFFIVFATILSTGLVSSFTLTSDAHPIGAILGFLLVCISFIFWKLDERNKFLTKHGEPALKYIESQFKVCSKDDEPHPIQLFTSEEKVTKQLRETQDWWKRQMSFSESFKFLFLLYGVIGLVGAVVSIVLCFA
jgi:hypothetical protein